MKSNGNKLKMISAVRKIVPLVFKEAPLLFLAFIFCSICLGLFWAANTMFMQRFFDSATKIVDNPNMLSGAIQALLMVAILSCMNQIINFANNFVTQAFAGKTTGRLSLKVHNKISRLSPIIYEDTNILDCINKAEQGKNNAVWFILTFFIIICYYIPYFVFMSFYLFSIKPILSIAILIVFIPTVLTQMVRTRVFSKLEDESAPIRRKNAYFESCIVGRESFKETRILGAYSYFKKLYYDTLKLANNIKKKADVKTNVFELFMKLVTLTGYCLILFGLFVFLLNGEISVGAFAAVFNAIAVLFSIMDEVICGHIGNISQNFPTINNFLIFLDLEQRDGVKKTVNKNEDIYIDNISFKYPNSTKEALKNVSFTINKGETVAIVGENGSGKTTLVRLLCGLYLPQKGSIRIGDVDTKDPEMYSLFENISAVFQSYNKYQMVLKDNIGISKMENSPTEFKLTEALAKAGINDMHIFPYGFETMLSREFDGIDLSGGEWQKVAISRGLYREHDIIFLDEPTAAIDPIEESNIYNRFADITKEKTAVIVTHRLGSVKLADRILVLDGGELVEIGTHSELLSQNGHYARMFKAQEHWYK
jgi:ATP-binding cassette subfamily B protein